MGDLATGRAPTRQLASAAAYRIATLCACFLTCWSALAAQQFIKGKSGATYEIYDREARYFSRVGQVFYVVKFRADQVADTNALRLVAYDILGTFEAEAESQKIDALSLRATRRTSVGTLVQETGYGFTFQRDASGIWKETTDSFDRKAGPGGQR